MYASLLMLNSKDFKAQTTMIKFGILYEEVFYLNISDTKEKQKI
jgi:hypothetical protein